MTKKNAIGAMLSREAKASRKAVTMPPVDVVPHLFIFARAGTGKTTTIIQGVNALLGLPVTITPSPQQCMIFDELMRSKGIARSICFAAFGTGIVEEIKSRLPPGCDVMTVHGMGLRSIRKQYPHVRVDKYRPNNLLRDMTSETPLPTDTFNAIIALVDKCKTGLVEPTRDNLDRLSSYYEIDCTNTSQTVYPLVVKLLDRCKLIEKDQCVDFNDMLWLPLVLKLPVYRYDLLLVDEAQDLNKARQELCKLAGKRLVFVGDDRQAIFGFTGADTDSLANLQREVRPNTVLPLTVTRRCCKAVVRRAQKLVPDFEAHPDNPEGIDSTARWPYDKNNNPINGCNYRSKVMPGDMIVCRVNAPLISECMAFWCEGKRAKVLGKKLGDNLLKLIKKSKADTLPALITWLDNWLESETTKERARKEPSEAKLINLQDTYDCLQLFAGQSDDIEHMIDSIKSLFTDDESGNQCIRLSSIHKAKGLEAHRVFFINTSKAPCPHPMAKSAWAQGQERNLYYVAVTRAIEELVIVS